MIHGPAIAAKDEAPSPEMIVAMRRDLGLSEAEVHRRIAFEAAAPAIEKAVKTELSDRFGGTWLNKEGTQLIVGVTNEVDAAIARSAGAEPRLVAHTLEKLQQVQAALDAQGAFGDPSIHGTYVDVTNNRVVVLVESSGMSLASVDRFISGLGVDKSSIRVEPSAERPQTFYNLVGGNAYYINGSSRCSIGFAVTAPGFVTAGHCGYYGATTTGYNGVSQGSFRGSSFPGNDYAWVGTNSSWTPTSSVAGSGSLVYGSSVAGVGSSVCRSGSTTGWRCNYIQALNATVYYSQGAVYGLTRTSVCAEPGDSGGSFITGTNAQGVTSGGSGNCSSGGTTYFQPVNEILSVYGLTLKKG
jgi:streptogrisin C